MIMYKRNFDESRQICFFIQKVKVFVKYMKILEKVRNIIKSKFNRNLIYSEKYLKAKNKLINKQKNKHKRRLSMFICTINID